MGRRQKGSDAKELTPDEPCPCGSGLRYGQCHAKTAARYFRDSEGIAKRIPLSKPLIAQLRRQSKDFERVFGRRPDDSDLIFYSRIELGADDQLFIDFARVAKAAGIDEELAYAARRRQRIVAEMNLHLLSATEKREWQAAIEEYRRSRVRGHNPFHRFTFLGPKQFESYLRLVECVKEVAYVLDMAIHYAVNVHGSLLRTTDDSFVLSTMANTAMSLITISRMFAGHFSNDVIGISRAIFEDYLRIKCLRVGVVSGDALIAAQMAARGYVEYAKRPNGKPDFDRAVWGDGASETINVGVARSYSRMSKATGDPRDEVLYDVLYRELSAHVHRDAIKVLGSLRESGTLPMPDENDRIISAYWIAFVVVVYLSEVSKNEWLGTRILRDLAFKSEEISRLLAHLGTSKRLMARVPLRFV